ncbi:ABC transporter ATP-binding protein [candidate division CSSED10-310 bacterium]|uniref:ABC transporter ATP-binding protein n=1 Tax=candidate division CSSED10-310 bacterium TaxID=2855610 RepID=A0ABV6Z2L4_UNCC1
MIELDGLSKTFGRVKAVNNISLTIPQGQFFGFLGPNGAGKTTTIKILAGLLKPTSGRVTMGGFDITTDGMKAKKITGYIPDKPFLYEKLTAHEFLEFIARIYELEWREAQQRMKEYLDIFRLSEWKNELIESFSHGMKQKLVMSAALLHNPQIIIVDEPMVGLDPEGALLVRKIFKNLVEQGVTIFMSTHTLPIAQQLCDRIVIIQRGIIVADGDIDTLKQKAHSGSNELEDIFLQLTRDTEEMRLAQLL